MTGEGKRHSKPPGEGRWWRVWGQVSGHSLCYLEGKRPPSPGEMGREHNSGALALRLLWGNGQDLETRWREADEAQESHAVGRARAPTSLGSQGAIPQSVPTGKTATWFPRPHQVSVSRSEILSHPDYSYETLGTRWGPNNRWVPGCLPAASPPRLLFSSLNPSEALDLSGQGQGPRPGQSLHVRRYTEQGTQHV